MIPLRNSSSAWLTGVLARCTQCSLTKDPSAMNSSKLTNCLHKIYPDLVDSSSQNSLEGSPPFQVGASIIVEWAPLSAHAMNFDYRASEEKFGSSSKESAVEK